LTDPLAIVVVLAAVVLLAVFLEERYALFRSLGSALVGILAGMALSNAGLIPGESPAYEFLMGTGVSVGIALILLGVDLRTVVQAGPRMLGAFLIGAVGTAIGAGVGGGLLAGRVGPETWKLAGQYTGTYTGGGMNFAALGQAFDTSSSLFAAATAADVIITAVWMVVCLGAPLVFSRSRTAAAAPDAREVSPTTGPPTLERRLHTTTRRVVLGDVAALGTIAIGSVWLAGAIETRIPAVPAVLWLTTIVLILAQVPAIKRLSGAALLGNYLVLLFLASNGARSVVSTMLGVGPAVLYFALMTVAIHGAIIFGVGRIFRIDLPTLAVASQANVGGAASAIALAGARGYGDRLVPGVAVGLLGYALGNYSGFAVAALLRGWLTG